MPRNISEPQVTSLDEFESWLKSPDGSDLTKRTLEDSDRLVERIQRETAGIQEPEIVRSRLRRE